MTTDVTYADALITYLKNTRGYGDDEALQEIWAVEAKSPSHYAHIVEQGAAYWYGVARGDFASPFSDFERKVNRILALKGTEVRVVYINPYHSRVDSAERLTGIARNLVGADDTNFWFEGDEDEPRLWLTRGMEHFIPLGDIISIDAVVDL